METRKLQEVGGGTFTVSIPKGWARDHGLEGGMDLRLYTHHDGSLLVRSSDADGGCLDEVAIDVDADGPDAVRWAIRTAHAAGFETITIRSAEPFTDAERKAAQSTVRGLVGTDITAESDAAITVSHMLDASSVSVRQSVVQLQYVAIGLQRDAIDAFLDAADAHARVRDRADEARRSAEMITRHLSRSLVSHAELDALDVSRPELFVYYVTAECLETVVGRAVRIAALTERLPGPVPGPLASDLRSAAEGAELALDDAVTAIFDGDTTTARRSKERCADAVERIDEVERALFDGTAVESVPTAVALAGAIEQLRRMAACGRRVADAAARSTVRARNLDL
ncbi:phosphate uptake regulator PhoU [Haloparvum alkalitolerans]|uniref:phosphate uptake regulator PhoU n=1 Tax=Haloparvum alkalitolerans TaxID=1042953 RepID=UPI003CF45A5E